MGDSGDLRVRGGEGALSAIWFEGMLLKVPSEELFLTACIKTDRETLLPEVMFLGSSPRMHHFKGKSSIWD
jgi:hypothetical protein